MDLPEKHNAPLTVSHASLAAASTTGAGCTSTLTSASTSKRSCGVSYSKRVTRLPKASTASPRLLGCGTTVMVRVWQCCSGPLRGVKCSS